jgi:hypothetical protein
MESESAGYVVRGRVVEWDATRAHQVEDVLAAWDAINADSTVVPGSGLLINNGESDFDVPASDVERLAAAVAERLPKISAVAILTRLRAPSITAWRDSSKPSQTAARRPFACSGTWLRHRSGSRNTRPLSEIHDRILRC